MNKMSSSRREESTRSGRRSRGRVRTHGDDGLIYYSGNGNVRCLDDACFVDGIGSCILTLGGTAISAVTAVFAVAIGVVFSIALVAVAFLLVVVAVSLVFVVVCLVVVALALVFVSFALVVVAVASVDVAVSLVVFAVVFVAAVVVVVVVVFAVVVFIVVFISDVSVLTMGSTVAYGT